MAKSGEIWQSPLMSWRRRRSVFSSIRKQRLKTTIFFSVINVPTMNNGRKLEIINYSTPPNGVECSRLLQVSWRGFRFSSKWFIAVFAVDYWLHHFYSLQLVPFKEVRSWFSLTQSSGKWPLCYARCTHLFPHNMYRRSFGYIVSMLNHKINVLCKPAPGIPLDPLWHTWFWLFWEPLSQITPARTSS